MKTQADVEALKVNWMSDPIWDIEETEGFEEYKVELKVFRLKMMLKWQEEKMERESRQKEARRLEEKAEWWGCSEGLVEYLERMEAMLVRMTEALEQIRAIQEEVHPVFWDRNGGTERRMR